MPMLKQEVLGRTNCLLSFDTLTAKKTKKFGKGAEQGDLINLKY
jgi:hypothetical protein